MAEAKSAPLAIAAAAAVFTCRAESPRRVAREEEITETDAATVAPSFSSPDDKPAASPTTPLNPACSAQPRASAEVSLSSLQGEAAVEVQWEISICRSCLEVVVEEEEERSREGLNA